MILPITKSWSGLIETSTTTDEADDSFNLEQHPMDKVEEQTLARDAQLVHEYNDIEAFEWNSAEHAKAHLGWGHRP